MAEQYYLLRGNEKFTDIKHVRLRDHDTQFPAFIEREIHRGISFNDAHHYRMLEQGVGEMFTDNALVATSPLWKASITVDADGNDLFARPGTQDGASGSLRLFDISGIANQPRLNRLHYNRSTDWLEFWFTSSDSVAFPTFRDQVAAYGQLVGQAYMHIRINDDVFSRRMTGEFAGHILLGQAGNVWSWFLNTPDPVRTALNSLDDEQEMLCMIAGQSVAVFGGHYGQPSGNFQIRNVSGVTNTCEITPDESMREHPVLFFKATRAGQFDQWFLYIPPDGYTQRNDIAPEHIAFDSLDGHGFEWTLPSAGAWTFTAYMINGAGVATESDNFTVS